MDYEIPISKLGGKANLLYVPIEKQLYVKRYERVNGTAYKCHSNYINKMGNACPHQTFWSQQMAKLPILVSPTTTLLTNN